MHCLRKMRDYCCHLPAGAAFALEPPNKNENADFGPNEVDTKKIGEVADYADNKFDTAAPGTIEQRSLPVIVADRWLYYSIHSSLLMGCCQALDASIARCYALSI